jgi:two-component system OmpR family sensor kinase
MRRLPIRLRLTLAFALAMTVVLGVTGVFLYLGLGSSLDEAIDEGLEARLADVSTLVVAGESDLGAIGGSSRIDPEESFTQVLDPAGRIVGATAQAGERPVLDRDALARAEAESLLRLEQDDVPGLEGRARLLAATATTRQGRRVVVVGASLADRDEAVQRLLGQLLIVGPAALLVASLLGYALAAAALRPVESMRTEAAAISDAEPGRRLPLASARDEIRRLGETLNAMLERLERALARERRFVADASHELRTPLALLKAELELALRRPRSVPELERALRSAAAETDRLAQLAEDLLVLARSDQERLPLRRTAVVANDIVESVAARFMHHAEATGRPIEIEAPAALRLIADRLRLEQALGNLVANALRHGAGSIRLSAVEHDGHVELHVRDEGPGFPPTFLPQAFERFSRADQARSGGGAGLGLAIANVIAKAHGGTAQAANRDGGADVWLSLPKA